MKGLITFFLGLEVTFTEGLLFHEKIPPNLPLPKGGTISLFGKEGRGEILWKWEIYGNGRFYDNFQPVTEGIG